MPFQAFEFELKSVSDQGQFTGFASTYSNTDAHGEAVLPGAFARTLSESGKQRPLLWQHREPIGLVTLRDTPTGLLADGQLSMGVQMARDAYEFLKDHVIDKMSIGFQTVRDQVSGGVRQLVELKLFEVSLVTVAANDRAAILSVKSLQVDELSRAARELRDFYQTITRS